MNKTARKSQPIKATMRFLFGLGLFYIAIKILAIGGLLRILIGTIFLIVALKVWMPRPKKAKRQT